MQVNASALNALATVQAVSANNLANMNTNRFQASNVHLAEQAPRGVEVAGITRDTSTGPLVPEQRLVEEDGRIRQTTEPVPGSTTDPVEEFVTMMSTEHAFSANAKALQTQAAMLGTIVDMQA